MNVYFLLILLFSPCFTSAQMDPLSLTNAIFNPEGFPELKQRIMGEYNGHPNGEVKTCMMEQLYESRLGRKYEQYITRQ